MKIAPLLAEYLLIHKRLDLPGIGSFLLDSGGLSGAEPIKTGNTFTVEGARFVTNTGIRDTTDLVNFISTTTGKLKALAAADLDSHLENARQFLNIGKPFQFEGIGSLTKLQSGEFSFTPGAEQVEKVGGKTIIDHTEDSETEETAGGFKNIFYARKVKTDHRKTVFILLLIIGLALAIWGGYTVYKRTTAKNNSSTPGRTEEKKTANDNKQALLKEETALHQKDSIVQPPAVESITPGQYKFVVESADKTRGLQRYGLLSGFGLPVKMKTKDSITFHIYFQLPASAADTARVLDSLRQLYTPAGKKAFVEK